MSTLPLADVKARLSAVVDGVTRTHDRVVVTRNGRPEVVIMSIDDLEALEETLDILGTEGLPAALDAASQEIDEGQSVGADELMRTYLNPRR